MALLSIGVSEIPSPASSTKEKLEGKTLPLRHLETDSCLESDPSYKSPRPQSLRCWITCAPKFLTILPCHLQRVLNDANCYSEALSLFSLLQLRRPERIRKKEKLLPKSLLGASHSSFHLPSLRTKGGRRKDGARYSVLELITSQARELEEKRENKYCGSLELPSDRQQVSLAIHGFGDW